MSFKSHHQTGFWLIVSACLLSSLIPGGPIENRDFSHIHTGVLGAFNIFLTVLDLGSLVLAYFAIMQRPWALSLAFAAAVGFFGVYAVDLAQFFPRSPTPMSLPLAVIEVLGMTAAVPLMFASRRALTEANSAASSSKLPSLGLAIAVALVIAGIAIVWFATDAAMSGSETQLQAQRTSAPLDIDSY